MSNDRTAFPIGVLLSFVLVYTLLHEDFGRSHEPRQGPHGSALAAAAAGAIGL